MLATSLKKNRGQASGILPLANGIDAFTARYILIKNAERSIDLQYYIWHNDTTGKLLAYALLKVADRGVRVRILLDDINTAEKDELLLALNHHRNIEVRVFNPFPNRATRFFDIITDFFRVNRRMHNKSFTIDNQFTIVGGRNIGDEYFEASPLVDFYDFDVMAVGDVVDDVSVQFDKYWNHRYAYPINKLAENQNQETPKSLRIELEKFFVSAYKTPYVQAVKKSDFIRKLANNKYHLYWNRAKVFYDPPDKIDPDNNDSSRYLLPQLTGYIDSVQNETILISPYFIPGWRGMRRIKELTKRGVSVKILTNSLASTDVPIVYSGYAPYRVSLLENNV
ncbi:MAG: phospholipase D family protein, partial [Thioalkalispiraceae bacterium]